jgi:hypothetical protein
MSDENTLAEAPGGETATPETKVETPVNDGIVDLDAQPEVEETKDKGEDDDGKPESKTEEKSEDGEDEPKKKLSGAQRAKIREQRLLQELQQREREIEELKRSAPAKTASEDGEKAPREEDFSGDWFAWQQALTAFKARQAIREELRADREAKETSERQSKQAEIARERKIAHAERVEDAREVIADFDQVLAGMKGVDVRSDVIDEIMASDKSALLTYYLAKNPEKLSALNSMSGRELAREMGRLEATVRMPEAKKATTAPAPLSRPKGGAAPASQEAILQAYLTRTYGRK